MSRNVRDQLVQKFEFFLLTDYKTEEIRRNPIPQTTAQSEQNLRILQLKVAKKLKIFYVEKLF